LHNLKGQSYIASLFNWFFVSSCRS